MNPISELVTPPDTITVRRDEYERLIRASERLDVLGKLRAVLKYDSDFVSVCDKLLAVAEEEQHEEKVDE